MKQLKKVELKRFLKKDRKEDLKSIVVVAENIQYATNVANMFRLLDAIQVEELILTGISHKPPFGKDLKKTSRSKEKGVRWKYVEHPGKEVNKLKEKGYEIIALEITDKSTLYTKRNYPDKICVLVGNETYGVVKNTLEKVDSSVYIPMYGKGASLNVTMSLGILCYHIREAQ